jgi:bifunctional DNA-binding transcriptional regulator/antitoxin component of YhaV-PrlF toxin-antitoxin module
MVCQVKVILSNDGSIVLPVDFRRRDGVKPGQEFHFERSGNGEYRLKRAKRRRNEGLVDLLLSCPVKGWFRPIDRSETTDDIDGT